MNEKHVAIVGGGITGLVAAYRLVNLAKAQGMPVKCTLIEADARFGGKIRTFRAKDTVVELGPDSIFTPKRAGLDLIRELSMEDQVVGAKSVGGTRVLFKRRLHPMPPGVASGIPTDFRALAKTALLTPFGKARALADVVLPMTGTEADLSLGRFLRHRLGDEVVDILAAPMLAGIHAADVDKLSLDATMPMLRKMHQEHRSLVLGALASKKQRAAVAANAGPGPTAPMFITLKGGLESLVEHMASILAPDVQMQVNTRVTRVKRCESGQYTLLLEKENDEREQMSADAVVIATPAFVAADMLADLLTDVSVLRSIRYASTSTVLMGFARSRIPADMPAFSGFLVPPTEPTPMTACTVVSQKWPDLVPKTEFLLRCYVGRDGDEGALEWQDKALVDGLMSDLQPVFGKLPDPDLHLVTRWYQAMPQYEVGHKGRVAAIEETLGQCPGIELAGAAYRGMGIPDCITDGTRAANRIIDFLNS